VVALLAFRRPQPAALESAILPPRAFRNWLYDTMRAPSGAKVKILKSQRPVMYTLFSLLSTADLWKLLRRRRFHSTASPDVGAGVPPPPRYHQE